MKFSLSVFDKIFKNPTQNVFYFKIENQSFRLDGLIISVPLLTFSVRKQKKFFVKWVKKCTSAHLNFASLFTSGKICIFKKQIFLPNFDWKKDNKKNLADYSSFWCNGYFFQLNKKFLRYFCYSNLYKLCFSYVLKCDSCDQIGSSDSIKIGGKCCEIESSHEGTQLFNFIGALGGNIYLGYKIVVFTSNSNMKFFYRELGIHELKMNFAKTADQRGRN